MRREIVRIDEEKCDGCGACVPACAEGALQIIDGKARLVSEVYCDGLGACLGECPRGAITIEERDVEEFDEGAVRRHLAHRVTEQAQDKLPCGCPGSTAQVLERSGTVGTASADERTTTPSSLSNWPVQLRLVPVRAPYFDGADLLIAADCIPFAFADFHQRFLAGRTLLVGCPKLDDADLYRRKLAQIFLQNDIRTVTVLHMEVPCCLGLVHLVQLALKDSGKPIHLAVSRIGIKGEICETSEERIEACAGGKQQ